MSDDENLAPPRRRGRPRKEPAAGKRGSYSFRMADITRDRLMALAQDAGRSLSEEMEYRIERSLQRDGRLHAVLTMIGGADRVMLAALANGHLQIAIDEANKQIGSSEAWYDSSEKLEVVLAHMRAGTETFTRTYASLVRTGVAKRSGEHFYNLANDDLPATGA